MCDSACSPLAAPSSFLLCVPLWWTGGHAELYNSSSSCRPSQLQPSWINASSCYCSNTIPRSLCCLCALYLQLPMLATVAVLSMQPWSSCRRAAFADPPTLGRRGGGGFRVPTTCKQHRWAKVQSNRYTVSVSNIYPARLTLSEAIQVKKPSEKFQYDYLYIVISVFFTI